MLNEAFLKSLRERLLSVGEDISGLILFGSSARGEVSARDMDVLVVLKGPEVGRPQRDRALVALRKALGTDGLWVDLVVVTEEGLQVRRRVLPRELAEAVEQYLGRRARAE